MTLDVHVEHFAPSTTPRSIIEASARLLDALVWQSASGCDLTENLSMLSRNHLVSAQVTGEVVGVGTVRITEGSGDAYLSDLAVSTDYQRHGIGSMVLSAIENVAREAGAEIIACNPLDESMPFYTANGYTPDTVHKDEFTKHLQA